MSFVLAAPELIAQTATDLANIGSAVSAAHMAAATPTVAVIPAAADEVSASIAHLFSVCAQDYQALAGQAAAFHEQFVQHLNASAGSYASAEAANSALLQPLTASAGSFATFENQLVNLFNGAFGPNALTNLDNALIVGIAIVTIPLTIALLLPAALLIGLFILALSAFPGLASLLASVFPGISQLL